MKKFLIILTFLFSTMFFVNNVNAEDNKYHYFYNYSGVTYDIYYDDTNKEVCVSNTCIDIIKPYFYFFWQGTNLTVVQSDQDDIIVHQKNCPIPGTTNHTYFCSMNSNNNYDGFLTSTIGIQSLKITTTKNFADLHYGVKGWNQLVSNVNLYNTDGTIYFEKNLDVTINTKPTVSIKKENETTVTIEDETFISSVTLNIEFSVIDNDKYLYMYKYGSSNDWSTITLTQSNSFTKTFNTNDTLYVQILDKTTHETISSATYTISSINYTFEPYVDVTESIPTACSFYKNGRSYTICKDINLSAKNLKDGNYISSYSYDKINWVNFVNTTISINENKTIYFKIYNYLTNEVSYTSTYTVGSIDTDISNLGVFNTYSSSYDKNTSFITAYIYIYNLLEPVQDNYKIYYSFNSTSFNDITLLLTDMTNYYQYEINNINEDKTIYFKITDLNDNILYTSTYTINYQIEANENSNFFTNFRTNFHGLSDIIITPLYAIKKINTGVCTPLEIPIPYTDKNISLPCMTTVYENNIPNILNIWQIVTNGIISYYIILDLFRIVKSFKDPEQDKIEVVDL